MKVTEIAWSLSTAE